MSKEKAYEVWLKKHLEECVRDLPVGATVYRVRGHGIQEGTVVKIIRARLIGNDHGDLVEDPNGPYIQYYARFSMDFEKQTTQCLFFSNRGDAEKKLVVELRKDAEDLRRQAMRLDNLAETLIPNSLKFIGDAQ